MIANETKSASSPNEEDNKMELTTDSANNGGEDFATSTTATVDGNSNNEGAASTDTTMSNIDHVPKQGAGQKGQQNNTELVAEKTEIEAVEEEHLEKPDDGNYSAGASVTNDNEYNKKGGDQGKPQSKKAIGRPPQNRIRSQIDKDESIKIALSEKAIEEYSKEEARRDDNGRLPDGNEKTVEEENILSVIYQVAQIFRIYDMSEVVRILFESVDIGKFGKKNLLNTFNTYVKGCNDKKVIEFFKKPRQRVRIGDELGKKIIESSPLHSKHIDKTTYQDIAEAEYAKEQENREGNGQLIGEDERHHEEEMILLAIYKAAQILKLYDMANVIRALLESVPFEESSDKTLRDEVKTHLSKSDNEELTKFLSREKQIIRLAKDYVKNYEKDVMQYANKSKYCYIQITNDSKSKKSKAKKQLTKQKDES